MCGLEILVDLHTGSAVPAHMRVCVCVCVVSVVGLWQIVRHLLQLCFHSEARTGRWQLEIFGKRSAAPLLCKAGCPSANEIGKLGYLTFVACLVSN